MKKWLYELLWRVDTELLFLRTSESMREIAILWLVFANLDKLVANELTMAWGTTHSIAAAFVWGVSLYIEVHGSWRHR